MSLPPSTPSDRATIDAVAAGLSEIVVLARTELAWSDGSADLVFRKIAAEAVKALVRLGYDLPDAPATSRSLLAG